MFSVLGAPWASGGGGLAPGGPLAFFVTFCHSICPGHYDRGNAGLIVHDFKIFSEAFGAFEPLERGWAT